MMCVHSYLVPLRDCLLAYLSMMACMYACNILFRKEKSPDTNEYKANMLLPNVIVTSMHAYGPFVYILCMYVCMYIYIIRTEQMHAKTVTNQLQTLNSHRNLPRSQKLACNRRSGVLPWPARTFLRTCIDTRKRSLPGGHHRNGSLTRLQA